MGAGDTGVGDEGAGGVLAGGVGAGTVGSSCVGMTGVGAGGNAANAGTSFSVDSGIRFGAPGPSTISSIMSRMASVLALLSCVDGDGTLSPSKLSSDMAPDSHGVRAPDASRDALAIASTSALGPRSFSRADARREASVAAPASSSELSIIYCFATLSCLKYKTLAG